MKYKFKALTKTEYVLQMNMFFINQHSSSIW